MQAADFKKHDIFDFEGNTTLWGEPLNVGLDLPESLKEKNQAILETYINAINERIQWLETHRKQIEQAVLDDDMVSLAEDWIAGLDEAEGEAGTSFVMEDGQIVHVPISEEDFCASLHCSDGITISFEDGEPVPDVSMYLVCDPDYFAYHCIEIFIETDNKIVCNGLAG